MAHKDLSHLSEIQIKDLIKHYYNFETEVLTKI